MTLRPTRHEPTVVLIGRPNVGKSTLFNRVTRSRRAIVTPVAGTTRDALVRNVDWNGARFRVVDTGGLFGASADPLAAQVAERGRQTVREADLLVLMVDGLEGPVPADDDVAGEARRAGVPVVVAVNKTDDRRARERAAEFHRFGFEPVVEISAEHGRGVGELLDEIVKRLEPRAARGEPAAEAALPQETGVAIIGRPNVGKSSLFNRLVRRERSLVDEMPGTTRDAIDEVMKWHGRSFRLVDTAGIRRAGRVARSGQVESISVVIARKIIAQADVAVVLIDAVEGAAKQDATIAGEAEKAGCGIIIAVNKWDLVKSRGPDFATTFDEELRRALKFAEFAPIVHVSALTGERTPKLVEMVDRVAEARRRHVATAELNRFVQSVTAANPPTSPGRREVRILFATQVGTAPPTFVFFTNVATSFHFSYERFLKNRLREAFDFCGTPIRLRVRRRKSSE